MKDRIEIKRRFGRRLLYWSTRIAGALFLIGIVAYPIVNALRRPLSADERAALIKAGKAQAFISLPLGTMHLRQAGPEHSPIVLLVHGGVVGGYAFEHWQKPLLDAGYRVIVPDLLGYGYSDRPDIAYDTKFYVDQLEQLLDGLGIKAPVNLIGASQGGGFATAFAAAHPSRIKSLGLMAPNGGGPVHVASRALLAPVFGDWVFRVAGAVVMRNMMDQAYRGKPERDGMLAWMDEQARYRGYGEGVLNSIRHTLASNALTWQPDAISRIGHSGIPVLAVWGMEDATVPFAQSREWQSRIPKLQLVALTGRGHAITFGQTDTVIGSVIPFLDAANQTEHSRR